MNKHIPVKRKDKTEEILYRLRKLAKRHAEMMAMKNKKAEMEDKL